MPRGLNPTRHPTLLQQRQKTGAESWAEFLERGDWGHATDRDDIQAPDFGFGFTADPLVAVSVPEPIASSGMVYAGGRTYGVRRIGIQVITEIRREDARELLSASPAWCSLNATLARELGLTG
jgi:hypothetical protein